MWDHRNKFLHDRNHSFHPKEIDDMNKEIESEFQKGSDHLPKSYSRLFPDDMQHILDKTSIIKLNWLVTIWTARELQHPVYLLLNESPAESLTRHQYLKWKESI